MPHPNMGNWRSKIAGKPVEYTRATSVQELVSRRPAGAKMFEDLNVDLPEIGKSHDVVMREAGGGYPNAEIYAPKGTGPFPVLLHIHGGGWFTGSAKGERKFAMQLCAAGFVVVNLNYRLAPEHPFPAGLQDCIYAARWIVRNIAKYGGRPESPGGGRRLGGRQSQRVHHAGAARLRGGARGRRPGRRARALPRRGAPLRGARRPAVDLRAALLCRYRRALRRVLSRHQLHRPDRAIRW